MKSSEKKRGRKCIVIIGWLIVWQLISMAVGNKILLVGPLETLQALIVHALEPSFWKACVGSVLRITLGFLAGVLLGVLLAMWSAQNKWLEEVLAPVMVLLKAVPVASFVVLFLIWWSSAWLASVISFCVTLPNLYINTLEGMKSTDPKLLEMAKVFDISGKDKFFYIYRPALRPFWDSAICLAAGMSWKSGVAAEVIGLPANAIGERLYMSKIHLDTAGVLAWTVMVVILSTCFERLVHMCFKKFGQWEPACKGVISAKKYLQEDKSGKLQKRMKTAVQVLKLHEVTKIFDGRKVLDGKSAEYCPGEIYYLREPSGSGKTTLFRLIAGLEQPEEGTVEGNHQSIGYLFQEDRLCEEYSAVKNVELITGNTLVAKEELTKLLSQEDIMKPCKELSGGMKRRVAIVRAVAAKPDILLLDEPYNGLDEENRGRVADYIEECGRNRIVLMATHIK